MPPSPLIEMTRRSGCSHLGADRRRQTEAHRSEAAGGDHRTRLAEFVILRRPHLVLADVGRHDRFAFCRFVQHFDDPLRFQHRVGILIAERLLRFGLPDPRSPFVRFVRAFHFRIEHFQNGFDVADDRNVRWNVFPDFRRVDVDVHDFGVRSEPVQVARYPVIETRPDVDQQIRLLDRHVRRVRSVHARHPIQSSWPLGKAPSPRRVVVIGISICLTNSYSASWPPE